MSEEQTIAGCTSTVAVCTTPWKTTPSSISRAKTVADLFGVRLVERKSRSIERILMDEACVAVIVMNEMPMVYHQLAPDVPVFFHPSMAAQRMIRMERGETDRLIASSGIRPSDTVLDATLGLGSDSLVFAKAVGEHGQVISLESVDILYHLFQYAKQHGIEKYAFLDPLMKRIQPVNANYESWLACAKDRSVDVVYFDPMFRDPKLDAPAINPLRPFANRSELSATALFHAKRIARKAVVVKERVHADIFSRFGLKPDKAKGSFAYGVWTREEGENK